VKDIRKKAKLKNLKYEEKELKIDTDAFLSFPFLCEQAAGRMICI
jgi:hypothetical protein